MSVEDGVVSEQITWQPVLSAFEEWLAGRYVLLEPGLIPEPTIKILTFLALVDSKKPCTYDDLREIFKQKNVINGNVPDNTLRTSVLNLGKSLDKAKHPFELKSSRGKFELTTRNKEINSIINNSPKDLVVLISEDAIQAEQIAISLIEKAVLSLPGLYFLEWSARWWETYSSKEAEIRVEYEAGAWEHLGIKERLSSSESILSIVGLAPGEGLAEIGLLKKILGENNNNQIHYLAIDSSPRLLRDHIGLLRETFTPEIENGKLICAGVVADIFTGLREAIDKTRVEFIKRSVFTNENIFLPSSSKMLVTYFGNCLGNNHQDQETEFFSMIHSIFQNRPLEILTGVSVMRGIPDKYIRNWDDFLLQSPRHLLETKKLLKSSQLSDNSELPEFILPQDNSKTTRCPEVIPEKYIVRHQIEGNIYRFYYKLAYDLELSDHLKHSARPLPKGTLILLHSIIKYNMKTLVGGIEKCGLFKVIYDKNYHQVVDTPNGKREYAVFSTYLEY
jgi:Histidine-specific methyltransferase, SAM-dependent